jgi:hypothetical protein
MPSSLVRRLTNETTPVDPYRRQGNRDRPQRRNQKYDPPEIGNLDVDLRLNRP